MSGKAFALTERKPCGLFTQGVVPYGHLPWADSFCPLQGRYHPASIYG